MIFDNQKKNQYVAGLDLGVKESQISFFRMEDSEPQTVPLIPGTQLYNIPTALCKRHDVSQWFYGRDAYRIAEAGEGILVDDLLQLAYEQDEIMVEDKSYGSFALLTLFMKRCLGNLNAILPLERMASLVISVRNLDARMIELLTDSVEGLGLKGTTIYFQNYQESFYHYMLRQPEELMKSDSVIFDYHAGGLEAMILSYNRRTTPVVSFVEQEICQGVALPGWSEEEDTRKLQERQCDDLFTDFARPLLQTRAAAAVYLVGEGFLGDWMQNSLRFLCLGRRVFKGNNLYSKGAAIAAMERCIASPRGRDYIFLGGDKLQANISLKIRKRGMDDQLPLLSAGTNWYDAKAATQLYLESGRGFTITVTPLTNVNDPVENTGRYPIRYEDVVLEHLPDRPDMATRLSIEVNMLDATHLHVVAEDLGLGELIPSSRTKADVVIEL